MTTATVTGQSVWCKVCGNLRTDGQPHCHTFHERDNAMKLEKTEEVIQRNKRNKVNPFMADDMLAALKTGDTFRINVETGDKPHSIVNQLREAATSVGMKVSVALDEGTDKLTNATTFRVCFRAAKTVEAPAAAPVKGKGK